MAVRFACPSCQQPIEIDDNWAGQSVACPYCRRVITAPRDSSWPPGEIPVASPARVPGASPPLPPLPPVGYPSQPMIGAAPYASRTAQGTGAASNWALVLSIASAVMSVVGMFIWFAIVGQLALDKTGPTPTEAQMQQALQEIILQRRVPVSPAATTAMLVGCFCGIAALVLGIRSLVRGEGRNGRAIAACLIAAVFVFCQVIVMAAMFVHPPGLQP